MNVNANRQPGRWGVAGAVATAVAASACCVLPLILLGLGVGGAWASSLQFLEPVRPVFAALTLMLLGFALYRAYQTPAVACSTVEHCPTTRPPWATRAMLWGITPLILVLLALPYFFPVFFGDDETPRARPAGAPTSQPSTTATQVVLRVEGITCAACTVTVKKSPAAIDGVQNATVTVDPPQAVVNYDPSRTSTQLIMKATADSGYPSAVVNDGKP